MSCNRWDIEGGVEGLASKEEGVWVVASMTVSLLEEERKENKTKGHRGEHEDLTGKCFQMKKTGRKIKF